MGDSTSKLLKSTSGNMTVVKDTRLCAVQQSHMLSNHESYIYSICDNVRLEKSLTSSTVENYPAFIKRRRFGNP